MHNSMSCWVSLESPVQGPEFEEEEEDDQKRKKRTTDDGEGAEDDEVTLSLPFPPLPSLPFPSPYMIKAGSNAHKNFSDVYFNLLYKTVFPLRWKFFNDQFAFGNNLSFLMSGYSHSVTFALL